MFEKSIREYAIGGHMITIRTSVTQKEMNEFVSSNVAKQDMREKLAYKLVQEMFDRNLIEIVSIKDDFLQMHVLTARCYLAKDRDVKILRTYT
jgi:hypothetical protein